MVVLAGEWLLKSVSPQLISLINAAALWAPSIILRHQWANSRGVSARNKCASTPFLEPVLVPKVKSGECKRSVDVPVEFTSLKKCHSKYSISYL